MNRLLLQRLAIQEIERQRAALQVAEKDEKTNPTVDVVEIVAETVTLSEQPAHQLKDEVEQSSLEVIQPAVAAEEKKKSQPFKKKPTTTKTS